MRRRIVRYARKARKLLARFFLPALAPLVRFMAITGIGTDACLRRGCLPMRVHFYSPVLDVLDLERRKVWDRRSPLPGIELNVETQLKLLADLGQRYGDECRWPENKTADRFQFFTNNSGFSFGCAAALYSMIRSNRPRRVIEIGSGNSSLVISQALGANIQENPSDECMYTIIDPNPQYVLGRKTMNRSFPRLNELIPAQVETLEASFFKKLTHNDILFIDSSHVVRTGGDVNFLYLEVLPILEPGVIVHCHDINLPFEYPKVYATNPEFRVYWTEAYLLQAFLAFNTDYEVLLAMALIQSDHFGEFQKAFPHFFPSTTFHQSGSFWIRRKLHSSRSEQTEREKKESFSQQGR